MLIIRIPWQGSKLPYRRGVPLASRSRPGQVLQAVDVYPRSYYHAVAWCLLCRLVLNRLVKLALAAPDRHVSPFACSTVS